MEARSARDRSFIGYSHADKKHLGRLKTNQKYFERKGLSRTATVSN